VRVVATVVLLLLPVLAGCGGTVTGTAATVAGPAAGAEAVAWMDRFCGTANFLVDAASTDPPAMPSDPTELRAAFGTQLTRLSGVLGTALIDFDRLREDPVAGGDVVVDLLYDDMAGARSRLDAAKGLLSSAAETTPQLLADVNEEVAKGVAQLERVVTTIGLLDLPNELAAAATAAPNCARR
jgi:hypothetical protein